jgi:hypothetical protein
VDSCPQQRPVLRQHPGLDNLPLLLLMQQMFRRRNSSLPVRIGQQIPWSSWFDAQSSARELTGRCYQHLEQLRKGLPGSSKLKAPSPAGRSGAAQTRTAQGRMPGPHRRWQSDLPLAAQRSGGAPLLRELGRLRKSPSARLAKAAANGGISTGMMTTICI